MIELLSDSLRLKSEQVLGRNLPDFPQESFQYYSERLQMHIDVVNVFLECVQMMSDKRNIKNLEREHLLLTSLVFADVFTNRPFEYNGQNLDIREEFQSNVLLRETWYEEAGFLDALFYSLPSELLDSLMFKVVNIHANCEEFYQNIVRCFDLPTGLFSRGKLNDSIAAAAVSLGGSLAFEVITLETIKSLPLSVLQQLFY